MSKLTLAQLVLGISVDDLKNFLLDTDLAGALRLRRKSDGTGGSLATFSSAGVMDVPGGLTIAGATLRKSLAVAAKTAPASFISFSAATSDGPPAWADTVTLSLSGVSLSGVDHLLVQLGSGSLQTTGYLSRFMNISSAGSVSSGTSTAGFGVLLGAGSAVVSGTLTLTRQSPVRWLFGLDIVRSDGAVWNLAGGEVTLSGPLDQIRVGATGSDTLDLGSISALYTG